VNGTFDPANADDPRVAYFSWAGSVPLKDVGPLFTISWLVLSSTEGPNDGPRCATRHSSRALRSPR